MRHGEWKGDQSGETASNGKGYLKIDKRCNSEYETRAHRYVHDCYIGNVRKEGKDLMLVILPLSYQVSVEKSKTIGNTKKGKDSVFKVYMKLEDWGASTLK